MFLAFLAYVLSVCVFIVDSCCVPPVFQCNMDVTGGSINLKNNHTEFIDRNVHLYFDYHRQMTRTDTDIHLGNNINFVHTEIVDYKNRKAYKIDMGRCKEEELHVPIQDQCIPRHATFVAEKTIGPLTLKLQVQVWKYVVPATNVTVVRAVTSNDCWPIYQMEYGTTYGDYSAMSYTTANVLEHSFPHHVLVHPKNCTTW